MGLIIPAVAAVVVMVIVTAVSVGAVGLVVDVLISAAGARVVLTSSIFTARAAGILKIRATLATAVGGSSGWSR